MFYEQFKKLCEQKGTTPTAFVRDILKISTSKVTAWKNGSIPKIGILQDIAKYFGVTVGYLFDGKEPITIIDINLESNDGFDPDNYVDCYIAFFDILNFKGFINNNNIVTAKSLMNLLFDLSFESSEAHTTSMFSKEELKKVKYNFISDTIVLSIPKKETRSLNILIFMVNTIISNLLFNYQLLVRGAISDGAFYKSGHVAFGSGLNLAAELEQKYAKYPRIIMSHKLVDEYKQSIISDEKCQKRISDFLKLDPIVKDGYFVLDYFKYILFVFTKNLKAKNTLPLIIAAIEKDLKSQRQDVREKNLYFAKFYNYALDLYNFKSKEEEMYFNNKRIIIPENVLFTSQTIHELVAEKFAPQISEEEQEILEVYNKLSEINKLLALGYIQGLNDSNRKANSNVANDMAEMLPNKTDFIQTSAIENIDTK